MHQKSFRQTVLALKLFPFLLVLSFLSVVFDAPLLHAHFHAWPRRAADLLTRLLYLM